VLPEYEYEESQKMNIHSALKTKSTEASMSITQLLNEYSQGRDDKVALNKLLPLVYADLKRRAKSKMWRERDDHTLQGTALVHEAFMRLGELRGKKWTSRDQFFAWMTELMRRILIDHARCRAADKRGSGVKPMSLDAQQDEMGEEVLPGSSHEEWEALLALNQALTHMAKIDPRQAYLVELRFFGGLSVEQTAKVLGVAPATVVREWRTARLWLLNQLGQLGEDDAAVVS
jgi:RNA polymerase sigma factor (TIGR02999 family)